MPEELPLLTPEQADPVELVAELEALLLEATLLDDLLLDVLLLAALLEALLLDALLLDALLLDTAAALDEEDVVVAAYEQ